MKMYAAMLVALVLGTICAVAIDRIAADTEDGPPPLVAVWNRIANR